MSTTAQPTTFQDHLKTLGEILQNLKKIGVHDADQRGQKCMSFKFLFQILTGGYFIFVQVK